MGTGMVMEGNLNGSSSEEDSSSSSTGRINQHLGRFVGLKKVHLAALLLIVILLAILNSPFSYESHVTSSITSVGSGFSFESPADFEMAGFPFAYSVHFPPEGLTPERKQFSILAAAGNVIVAGLFLAIAFRVLIASRTSTSWWKPRLSIADISMLTLLVAILCTRVLHEHRERAQHRELVLDIIRSGGRVGTRIVLPKRWGSVPKSIARVMRRIDSVSLKDPTNELVKRVVELPNLSSLRIQGDSFDQRMLEPLERRLDLRDVEISHCRLDGTTVLLLASLKRLNTLNVDETDFSNHQLETLNSIPNLQRLSAIRTRLLLAGVKRDRWNDHLKEFQCSVSTKRQSDRLTLNHWPELTQFRLDRSVGEARNGELKLSLLDMPKLERAIVRTPKLLDLTVENAPSLQQLRLPGMVSGIRRPTIRSLIIHDIPKLESLKFNPGNLESFSLRGNSPQLSLLFDSLILNPPFGQRTVGRKRFSTAAFTEQANVVIRGLENANGPAELIDTGFPMGGVDLNPLVGNDGIRQIAFLATSLFRAQVEQIAQLKGKSSIALIRTGFDSELYAKILENNPELSTLLFEWSPLRESTELIDTIQKFPSIHIRNHTMLKEFPEMSSAISADSVMFENLPRFDGRIIVGDCKRLVIRNVPSVRAICIGGRLPSKSIIGGVQNIVEVRLEGPAVSDEIFDALVPCKYMTNLTLEYTSVSAEKWRELPVRHCTTLLLPGNRIDDKAMRAWGPLPMLRELDLSQTQITGESLPLLAQSPNLCILRLNHCNVSPDSLQFLTQHTELEELSLIGIGLNEHVLDQVLAKNPRLRVLDLSETKLSDKAMGVLLERGKHLYGLTLTDCECDSELLVRLRRLQRNAHAKSSRTMPLFNFGDIPE